MSALSRKAWGDLRRHPGKNLLIILTLGLAIGSFAVVAVPHLLNTTMQNEVDRARLYDVAVETRDLDLSSQQLNALAHLPNVAAFDPTVEYSTVAGAARNGRRSAVILGVDLRHQPVDAVQVTDGQPPSGSAVMTDERNASVTGFNVRIGDHVTFLSPNGTVTSSLVSGSGTSLAMSPNAKGAPGLGSECDGPTCAVFYGTVRTVRALAGVTGFNYLAFRLDNNSPAAQNATIAAVRKYLTEETGASPFVWLPVTRASGAWPGQSSFNQIIDFFLVVTVMAVLCALFLIVHTVNTMVVEQANEIAVLKTLGGKRRQIAGVILRTAVALGAAGAVVGTTLGIGVAYLLTQHLAKVILNVQAGFSVSVPVIVASLLVGPLLAVLATLPGLRRTLRRPVAAVLDERVEIDYGTGRLDRAVVRTRLLSGPARMGVRNALRRKRRTAVTIAQITVAIALALGLFAVGKTVASTAAAVHDSQRYEIEVDANVPPLDARSLRIAASTPGVTRVEPLVESELGLQGQQYSAYGLGPNTLYHYRLSAGRWFTGADSAQSPPVVVLGPAVANAVHAKVGQRLAVSTPTGPTRVEVVGIDSVMLNNGDSVFLPLAQLQRLTNSVGVVNALWLTTRDTSDHFIDRVSASEQTRLGDAGYPVGIQKSYVENAQNVSTNNSVIVVLEALGLIVVGIALIGLVSTLTLAIMERTREVGILRCLGAGARQIRRVFNAEALCMALVGWALGSVFGYFLFAGLIAFIKQDFGFTLVKDFPLLSVPAALVAVILVTLLAVRPALHRAVHIQPGSALRYE